MSNSDANLTHKYFRYNKNLGKNYRRLQHQSFFLPKKFTRNHFLTVCSRFSNPVNCVDFPEDHIIDKENIIFQQIGFSAQLVKKSCQTLPQSELFQSMDWYSKMTFRMTFSFSRSGAQLTCFVVGSANRSNVKLVCLFRCHQWEAGFHH